MRGLPGSEPFKYEAKLSSAVPSAAKKLPVQNRTCETLISGKSYRLLTQYNYESHVRSLHKMCMQFMKYGVILNLLNQHTVHGTVL